MNLNLEPKVWESLFFFRDVTTIYRLRRAVEVFLGAVGLNNIVQMSLVDWESLVFNHNISFILDSEVKLSYILK